MDKQRAQEQFLARYLKHQPLTMFDIGVGPKTEAQSLLALYPEMKICGCEPLYFQYPEGTFDDYPGEIVPVAISDQPGTIEINYDPVNCLDASQFRSRPGMSTAEVTTWSLDAFDSYFGFPKRILLWMDIEGGELRALVSGERLLRSHRVRWVNLEERRGDAVPEGGWADPRKITEYLAGFGYVRHVEYNKHPGHQDVLYVYKEEAR